MTSAAAQTLLEDGRPTEALKLLSAALRDTPEDATRLLRKQGGLVRVGKKGLASIQ